MLLLEESQLIFPPREMLPVKKQVYIPTQEFTHPRSPTMKRTEKNVKVEAPQSELLTRIYSTSQWKTPA